jgi:serine phosphatase RsbU (regulator of sigma subunit)
MLKYNPIFNRNVILIILSIIYSHLYFAQQNIDSLWNIANENFNNSNYNESIANCEKIIKLSNNNSVLLNSNLLIGENYLKKHDYKKAIISLNECDKYNSTERIDVYYTMLIGDTYVDLKDFSNAIVYYEKAYNKTTAKNIKKLAEISEHIGNAYYKKNNYDKSIQWNKKALDFYSQLNNNNKKLKSLTILAKIYANYGDYNNAEIYFTKALKIAGSNNDENSIKIINDDLNKIKKNQSTINNVESEYNKKQDNVKNNLIKETLVKQAKSLDEIEKLSKENQLKEYKIKSQADSYEKKLLQEQLKSLANEKTLSEAKAKLNEEKIINEKQNTQLIAILIFAILLIILLSILFFMYKQKKKSNKLLFQKNDEIIFQKRQIEKDSKQIADSINYSQDIQKAFLPSLTDFQAKYPDSFVFHKPKDKVSGDFFWFKEIGDFSYIAVADCTGHGVPGAFMSIVCNEVLDTCVKNDTILTPDAILEQILLNFTKRLNIDSQLIGGMDISLIQIDKKSNTVKHAGARNPAYIVTDNKLHELKGSKFSIGYTQQKETNINLNAFDIQSESMVYLFSDGFPDQKGGEKGKKYFNSKFRDFVIKINELPIQNQKEEITKELNNWKKNYPQGDDILILGIQLNPFNN